MVERDDLRYGVFLVPDARTSAAVTSITGFVRAQFGLVSAQRFPPHVTLVGSLPLAVSERELLEAIDAVTRRHDPFDVVNSGVRRLGDATGVVFDVHRDATGKPNSALTDLAADAAATVQPLLRPVATLAADVRGREDWLGHLSLASHELIDRADVRDEVTAFIQQLDTPVPSAFIAATVTVYRLHHPDWSGPWWTTFWWEHLRSFRLATSS